MTVFQRSKISALSERWEFDAQGRNIYWAEAQPGADEGAEVWRIVKYSFTGSSWNADSKKWPSGSSEFKFSWTDRATYTYS